MKLQRLLVLGATASIAAAALTGCVRPGPLTTDTPEIGDVRAVVLDTSGDVTIREGEPSLTITAPEAVLERLTVEERNGVLELGRRPGPNIFPGAEVRYELTVRSLDSIEVNGSGDIDSTVSSEELRIEINGSGDVSISGVDADSVEVSISGSGGVELAGRSVALHGEFNGSGELDADDLEVREATIEVSGSGDADVFVTRNLTVEISGSGNVAYRGGARVDAEVTGSGSVDAG